MTRADKSTIKSQIKKSEKIWKIKRSKKLKNVKYIHLLETTYGVMTNEQI